MAKTYKIKLKHDAGHFLEKAKEASRKDGISFTGDARLGKFSVLGVKGNYRIENSTAFIDVTNKPILIPWQMVEILMHDFFL
jgi:hypothetical protein